MLIAWVSTALGLVLSLLASTARADLTVFYATDGPAAPLVASAVGSEGADARVTPVSFLPPRPAPREVLLVRVGDGSGDEVRLRLVDADGAPDPQALVLLSILARPRGTDAPRVLSPEDPAFVAPGILRLDPGLLLRLAALADRFPDRGIEIVSGYRPGAREGSRHRHGRALDLRVRGEDIGEVRAFLASQPETGVGFYPTSDFIHVDGRSRSVHWTDRSGPGEAPSIVRDDARAESSEGEEPEGARSIDDVRDAIDALQIDLGLDLQPR